MSFFTEYLKHPARIGAIAPSGKALAAGIAGDIAYDTVDTLVEYGPGTGVFTEEILKRRRPGTKLVLIEQNKDFCRLLEERFRDERDLYIVNGSAECIGMYLRRIGADAADCIVSGLPFTTLPAEKAMAILEATRENLTVGGSFVAFQYTLFLRKLFEGFFPIRDIRRVWRNLPPAYILRMEKDPEDRHGAGSHGKKDGNERYDPDCG